MCLSILEIRVWFFLLGETIRNGTLEDVRGSLQILPLQWSASTAPNPRAAHNEGPTQDNISIHVYILLKKIIIIIMIIIKIKNENNNDNNDNNNKIVTMKMMIIITMLKTVLLIMPLIKGLFDDYNKKKCNIAMIMIMIIIVIILKMQYLHARVMRLLCSDIVLPCPSISSASMEVVSQLLRHVRIQNPP
jgi:hypothetical protein